jgi:threonine/homoserine/homoserine lactone efflux protein
MYPSIFFKGFGIGFGIAAAVGPISLLCIRSTLTHGQIAGLAIGLGAALADAAYGFIAAFGLTFVSDFLLAHQSALRFFGGLFLIYLGSKAFFAKSDLKEATLKRSGLLNTVIGTFFLTMANPLTILMFLALFTGLGFDTESTNYIAPSLLVIGVFVGALIWWIILTSFLKLFHAHMNQRVLNIINICSGILIATFGVLSLLSLFIK